MLGWGLAVLFKIAQGSGTVSMITTAGMLGAMLKGIALPFHPVYLGTAIASGSLMASWMNDAGFWLVKQYFGLTVGQTIKSWSLMETIISVVGLLTVLLLSSFA